MSGSDICRWLRFEWDTGYLSDYGIVAVKLVLPVAYPGSEICSVYCHPERHLETVR